MSADYGSLGSGKQNDPCQSVAEADKSFCGHPLQHTHVLFHSRRTQYFKKQI